MRRTVAGASCHTAHTPPRQVPRPPLRPAVQGRGRDHPLAPPARVRRRGLDRPHPQPQRRRALLDLGPVHPVPRQPQQACYDLLGQRLPPVRDGQPRQERVRPRSRCLLPRHAPAPHECSLLYTFWRRAAQRVDRAALLGRDRAMHRLTAAQPPNDQAIHRRTLDPRRGDTPELPLRRPPRLARFDERAPRGSASLMGRSRWRVAGSRVDRGQRLATGGLAPLERRGVVAAQPWPRAPRPSEPRRGPGRETACPGAWGVGREAAAPEPVRIMSESPQEASTRRAFTAMAPGDGAQVPPACWRATSSRTLR